MPRSVFFCALALSFSVGLSACDGGTPKNRVAMEVETADSNEIEIIYSSIPETEVFTPGDSVKLDIEVSYKLDDPAGKIMIFVQQEEAGNPALHSQVRTIAGGLGQEQFTLEFIVPDTEGIHIFVPIASAGSTKSTVLGRLDFAVR